MNTVVNKNRGLPFLNHQNRRLLFTTFFILFILILSASVSPEMTYDEGMWNYIGYAWLHFDLAPYIGTLENKPPGIYIIYAISNYFFGINVWFPRLLGIIALTSTGLILYKISRTLINHTAGIITFVIFGLSMSWTALDGFATAHTESFMLFFTSLAFYLIMQLPNKASVQTYRLNLLAAGICLGLAVTFKQIAVATSIAVLFHYLNTYRFIPFKEKNLAVDLCFSLSGIILGLSIGLFPLIFSGVHLTDYWRYSWLVLLEGPGNSPSSMGIRLYNSFETWTKPEIALFYPIVYLFFKYRIRFQNTIPYAGLAVWALTDFVGANAAGYYYGHQLKQIIPSLSVITGTVIYALFSEDKVHLKSAIIILCILWLIPGSYFDAIDFSSKNTKQTGPRSVGLWLKENTDTKDYVYVYSRKANIIQAYSERRSPSRYFDLSFVRRSGAQEEISEKLQALKPRWILVEIGQNPPEWLASVINGWYTTKYAIENYSLYERKP